MSESFSILIVGNDAISSEMIFATVEHMGEVRVAHNADMAETYAREYKPDLILLDIQSPDTGGIELCKRLKKLTFAASTKFIYVTAEDDYEFEINAFANGADDFIKKPFNTQTLSARVALQLKLISQRRQLMQANQLQSKIFESLTSFVSCWDYDLRNVFHNDSNYIWFAHIANKREFPLSAIFSEQHYKSIKRHLVAMKLNGSESFELKKVNISGKQRALSVSLISETSNDKKLGFIMILSDITSQKEELQSLISDSHKYQAALTTIEEGVVATDLNANITYMNRTAQNLVGMNGKKSIGKKIDDVFIIKDVEDGSRLPHTIHYALQEQSSVASLPEAGLVNVTGALTPIEDISSPIFDNAGNITGSICVFHDTTQAKRQSRKLDYLTNYDVLTGLPNRVLLLDRLKQCLKVNRRENKRSALIIVNIDRFQKINDNHGYDVGDKLLQMAAEFFSSFVRQTDTLARHTGDEFVILLPEITKPSNVSEFCTKLLKAFTKKWAIEKHEFDLTITMGIAIAPADANEAKALYRMADIAMHDAKSSSRNNFRFYSDEIGKKVAQQMLSVKALKQAVTEKEIKVYYQPKVDATSQKVIGVEALVRWHKQDGSIAYPNEFIGLAERSNLIVPLGEHVLRTACRDGVNWLAIDPNLSIAINVSAIQFNTALIELLTDVLAETGFPAKQLEIEVTETVLINDEHAIKTFEKLKKTGVKLSLDDFGTGFSSLSYVKNFPLDILKIDQSFVSGMMRGKKDIAIVKTIINLAKDLQLTPVAEGVETIEHATTLQELGCAVFQGFYYSKAVAASQIDVLLSNQTVKLKTS